MAEAASPAAPAAVPIAYKAFQPGQWPQLTDEDLTTARELGRIGIPKNAALILLAMRRHGKGQLVTSWWLEHITDRRQPEVSIALAWLMKDGEIRLEKQVPAAGKGRPLKAFVMVQPVDEYVRKKIVAYRKETEARITTLIAIFPEAS